MEFGKGVMPASIVLYFLKYFSLKAISEVLPSLGVFFFFFYTSKYSVLEIPERNQTKKIKLNQTNLPPPTSLPKIKPKMKQQTPTH